MFPDAATRINLRHKTNFEGRQIALMPVSMIVYSIRLPGTGLEFFDAVGSLDEFMSLPKTSTIQFQVPDSHAELVKKLADSEAGLRVSAKVVFNAIGLKRRIESWTIDDIRNTTLGRLINAGGAAYYSVNAFEEMVSEVVVNRGLLSYEDPGLPDTVKSTARTVFDKIATASGELVIANQVDARAADEALRRGQGLTAAEFKPVQLGYAYTSDVLNQTRYEDANKKAEEFYEREQTALSVSAKASYGPVSGRASYNRTTDKWEHKKYESQKEYEDFQRTHRTENGQGVRFEARGLNLVEKGQLKNHLAMTVTAVTIRPVSLAGKLTVASTTATGASTVRGLDTVLQELAALKTELGQAKTALEASIRDHHAAALHHGNVRYDQSVAHTNGTANGLRGEMDHKIATAVQWRGSVLPLGNGIELRIHPNGELAVVDTKNGKVRWIAMSGW